MKQIRRLGAVLLTLCLLAGLLAVPAEATAPMMTPDPVTVLFTHDTHDHFYPDANGMGGYTRLATALKRERELAARDTAYGENGRAVVTLDAGDFSMGSLFQTIYATDAPELRALGAMGYDVTTLGNHEFDYRQQGLAQMLNAAKEGGEALPAIVQANYTAPEDPDSPEAKALTAALSDYPVTPYTVIQRDAGTGWDQRSPLRIAVFGVMGANSHEYAPMSGMVYQPMIDAAKRTVAEIQEKEQPDYIICLSHGGTEEGKGEDYELAKAVDGIDLIISGHTHTTLDEPIVVNGTPIVSCGPYTRNLGAITLSRSGGDGSLQYHDYRLIPLDGSISPDLDMTALAEEFKAKVDESYLSDYNMSYDGALTSALSDFSIPETGDLIGRAYIETVRELEGEDYDPIAFAVAPAGVIRGAVAQGEVTTGQAFDILSLGSGADGSPGYPLVSVYLTGKDMKNVFEVDASISGIMPVAELYGAGSWWHYNPNRMFLDRVFECQVNDGYGATAGPFADKKLYRVVADLYSGQMLSAVKEKSFGLLSITPRDKNGDPIDNFEDHIIRDGQGRELKAWQAFAEYLGTQTEVTPPQPSKTAWPSWSPLRLLIPMGWPTAVVCVLALALILAVVLILRAVLRRAKGRRTGYRPYQGRRK